MPKAQRDGGRRGSGKRRKAPHSPAAQPGDRGFWIVFGVALVVFLPSLGGEFLNWDDDVNFLNNPNFRGLGPDQVGWAFTTFLLGHYHPFTWLTLELDYALWGMDPWGYHLTNALLHAGAAAFFYLALVALLGAGCREEQPSAGTRLAAAAGALFWAVHPLRVESVAWISERRDVLCGLFVAATVWLYVKGRRGAALATFAAALGSKIVAATVPVWLLLLDVYPLRRGWTAKTLLEKAPFFLLALVAGLVAVGRYDAGVAGAAADLDLYPGLRAMLTIAAPAFYLWKTLAPVGLHAQYVYSADPQPGDWPLVAGAAVVAGISVAALLVMKRLPGPATAWGVYLAALAPTLAVFRLDRQQVVNDHHSYLAAGALAALAAGAWAQWDSRDSVRARVTAAVLLVTFGALTVRQIGFWRDSQTLWARTAEAQPESVIAHNNFGRALAEKGDVAAAAESFRRALAIEPNYPQAAYNLGLLLADQGKQAEAQEAFERALVREPDNARILIDLGNSFLRRQRLAQAIASYEKAVAAEPGFADAHFNLGLALALAGREADARERFRRTTELDPSNQEAWRRLGN